MLSALRKRTSYANVVATLALFFALSGGAAYAASHYLITSTKQIKPSVLSALKGRAGPVGTAGANGAGGATGSQGPQGPQGGPGSNGANGTNGASVTSSTLSAGNAQCPEGGSEFTAAGASKTLACNGAKGKEGSIGNALPKGVTETGLWSLGPVSSTVALNPIEGVPVASFAIKLKSGLDEGEACTLHLNEPCRVHFILTNKKEWLFNSEEIPVEAESTACLGTPAEPTATVGNLCIYAESMFHFAPPASQEIPVTKVGAKASFATEPGDRYARGSWAVTGE